MSDDDLDSLDPHAGDDATARALHAAADRQDDWHRRQTARTADMAVVADYRTRLAALLVAARQAGVEVAEDLIAAAVRDAARRVGGIEQLLWFRPGSWEASHVRQLGAMWDAGIDG